MRAIMALFFLLGGLALFAMTAMVILPHVMRVVRQGTSAEAGGRSSYLVLLLFVVMGVTIIALAANQ